MPSFDLLVRSNELVKTVDSGHTRLENLIIQKCSEDPQCSGVWLVESPLVLLAVLVDVELEEGGETGGQTRQNSQSISVGEKGAGE